MRLRHGQSGLTMWGWFYVLGTLGLMAMVAVQSLPIYSNQMAISKAVKNVAGDASLSQADALRVRDALQRYWDIEDIRFLETKDVKIKKSAAGRELTYEYEARLHLFFNVDIVYTFAEQVPMRVGGEA